MTAPFRSRRLLVWGVLALVYAVSYFHRVFRNRTEPTSGSYP